MKVERVEWAARIMHNWSYDLRFVDKWLTRDANLCLGTWSFLVRSVRRYAIWGSIFMFLSGCASGNEPFIWPGEDANSSAETDEDAQEPGDSTDIEDGHDDASSEHDSQDSSDDSLPSEDNTGIPESEDPSTQDEDTTDSESSETSESDGGSDDSTEEEDPESDDPESYVACGVRVKGVSINQSLEIALSEDGVELPVKELRTLVWRDRKSLFRVYLEPTTTQVRQFRVTLHLETASEVWSNSTDFELENASLSNRPDSTANFVAPARMLNAETRYFVELTQAADCEGESTDVPRLPANGTWAVAARTGPEISLRVFPVQSYNAPRPSVPTGFGDALVAALKARFPVANVEIEIDDSIAFYASTQVSGNSTGWSSLVNEIASYRSSLSPPVGQHFLALTLPSSGTGSGWGEEPTTVRAASGVINVDGDIETIVERAIHQLGHMHGQSHIACGASGDIDATGSIGVWGFHASVGQWLDPAIYRDMMASCTPSWINLDHYQAIAARAEQL